MSPALRNRKSRSAGRNREHREIVAGRGRKLHWTFGLLKPYRTRIIFMVMAVIASTAAALAPPYLAGRAIDSGIEAGNIPALNLTIALFVAAIIVNAVTSWLQTWLVGWVGIRVLQDLREQVFKHIQRMSIGFFNRNRPGALISRMTNDIEALNQLISDGIVTLFANLLTLFGVVAIMLLLDWRLALITF
ncbi:MAG TPA: ABC transporter transmembrane domain-containing protein, partial [Solirubrobacterales bacterium]|nr:ABC transporter transmembrane domain-containing protein [Solirubrobacterales bacterium]